MVRSNKWFVVHASREVAEVQGRHGRVVPAGEPHAIKELVCDARHQRAGV